MFVLLFIFSVYKGCELGFWDFFITRWNESPLIEICGDFADPQCLYSRNVNILFWELCCELI